MSFCPSHWVWLITVALAVAVIDSATAFAVQGVADPAAMRWAPSRTYHVKNYKLALHFSQSRGEVYGDELITIQPFESNFHRFCLNSTELMIDSVALLDADGSAESLAYATERNCLWITLKRSYSHGDTLNIRIIYDGRPRAGLYFVNPGWNDPGAPREIYTQGEPELNRYWFPCWDYPNDMSTSETITTVPDGQVVVSNGKLVSVKRVNGQVTYDWVESIPHSSYLTSIAVGPWRHISDSYDGKPVDYYFATNVDDAVAERSFHLTPDMIGFFSRITGVEYPYEKYDQVAVHDFIFGGQENVSATTLTDRTLHDARAELDYPSTILVAHELGQHWFGDYVQGRDWADIWLNEGFATYLTALYTQYHEGNDAYRYEIYNDQNVALHAAASGDRRRLVYRRYSDPLDMFDEITHQKGASVLDMMRYVLDGKSAMLMSASQREPLFQALNYYLDTYHGQAVSTADLMSSIWTKTGRDLGWFFYEWVFKDGHPDYQVDASYDSRKKMEVVKIAQTQTMDAKAPIFEMPIQLSIFGKGGRKLDVRVMDKAAQQEFDIPLTFDPSWVDFDPNDVLYKTVVFNKGTDELIREAENDPYMMSRLWATQELSLRLKTEPDCCVEALTKVLNNDSFYGVRAEAATGLGQSMSREARQALLSAMNQPSSHVRAAAILAMGNFLGDSTVVGALVKAMHNDPSYAVEAAAAEDIGESGSRSALYDLRSELASAPSIYVTIGVLKGMVATKRPDAASIVLAYAQPGKPERVRMTALSGLPELKDELVRSHMMALDKTVAAALADSFLPTHELAVHLVEVFRLEQFRVNIQYDADHAVFIDERADAKKVLEHLTKTGL